MKQLILISCLLLSIQLDAQVLKSCKPNLINPNDSNTLLLEFKNAYFTRYQNPYLIFNKGYSEAKILNDTSLLFVLPPFESSMSDSVFDIRLSCSDASWNPVTLNYPKLLKRINENKQYIELDSNSSFQQTPSRLTLKIKGKSSHFNSSKNSIQLNFTQSMGVNEVADSIVVMNDSLLYAWFNLSPRFEKGMYHLKLNNAVDGILKSKQAIALGNTSFQLRLDNNSLIQKGDSISFNLIFNEAKSGPRLNLNAKTELNIYHSELQTFVLPLELKSHWADSSTNTIYHQLNFKNKLPLKMKTGMMDLRFINDSLGTVYFNKRFSVFHDKPYIAGNLKSMPGRNFSFYISFLDIKNLPDSFGFSFNKNNQLSSDIVVDSFSILGSGYVQIHGHSTEQASGPYQLVIRTKEDVYKYDDFLTISTYFPFAFQLNPTHYYQNEDSAYVMVKSEYYSIIDYVNNLTNYQFEKAGQTIPGMSLVPYTADPGHNFKIILPRGMGTGWYDLKFFNTSLQKWEMQRNACYVYGPARGIAINKQKIASNGTGPIRIQMRFSGTHFTQANTSLMNNNDEVKIIHDSLVEFPFAVPENSLPGYVGFTAFNDVDGYIPCFPMIEVFTYPKIVALNPANGKAGDTLDIWVHTDMTTFTQFQNDISPVFRKNDQFESRIKILDKEIINDTLLKVKLFIESDMPAGKLDFGIFQNQSFAYYQLANAFEVINAGNGLNQEETNASIQIYPNPTRDYLVIENKKKDLNSYKIFTLKGELLMEGKLESGNTQISLSQLVTGRQMLILQVTGTQSLFKKILLE
ncbi:MAG: T9SS type A sorting domain-containing protein [Bacteroidia bacterium]